MTISLTYSDSRADLPASRGVGYPHIIITDGFNSGSKNARRLHAADGIVTLLNKFDPKALDAFLNLEKPFFVYHGEEVKLGHLLDAVVFREGNLVTVSTDTSLGATARLQSRVADAACRPSISPVKATGISAWSTASMIMGDGSRPAPMRG